jgi:hypothetical protein
LQTINVSTYIYIYYDERFRTISYFEISSLTQQINLQLFMPTVWNLEKANYVPSNL